MSLTLSHDQPFRLMNLPLELRDRIYGYLLPKPTDVDSTAYSNLRLTCSKLKAEFDDKLKAAFETKMIKDMQSHIAALNNELSIEGPDAPRITNPDTYERTQHLHVELPRTLVICHDRTEKLVGMVLDNLPGHVRSVMFEVIIDVDNKTFHGWSQEEYSRLMFGLLQLANCIGVYHEMDYSRDIHGKPVTKAQFIKRL